jgi:hypothetical protein
MVQQCGEVYWPHVLDTIQVVCDRCSITAIPCEGSQKGVQRCLLCLSCADQAVHIVRQEFCLRVNRVCCFGGVLLLVVAIAVSISLTRTAGSVLTFVSTIQTYCSRLSQS